MNSIEQRFIRFIIKRYKIVDSIKHVYSKVPYWYLNICFCVITTIQKQLNKSILTQNYEDMMPTYLLHALDTSVKYHIFNSSCFDLLRLEIFWCDYYLQSATRWHCRYALCLAVSFYFVRAPPVTPMTSLQVINYIINL